MVSLVAARDEQQAPASARVRAPFRDDGAGAVGPASDFAGARGRTLGLEPVAASAELHGAELLLGLADEVAFMGTSP